MAKKQIVKVRSKIGTLEVNPEKVLFFPRGLIGYETHQRFTLLQIRADSPFLLLQCLKDRNLGLLMADPYSFLSDYKVKIGQAEQKMLRLNSIRHVGVLVTVTIPPGRPEDTTLNLVGPIVINTRERIGMQIPQLDVEAPGHFRLSEQWRPLGNIGNDEGEIIITENSFTDALVKDTFISVPQLGA